MTVSTIAMDYKSGIRLTCILFEGTITVNKRAYTQAGARENIATLGAELYKGEFVQIDRATANTFSATNGMPVIEKLAADGGFVGRIISEPQWVKRPAETSGTWSTNLAGQYYRIATVEFYGIASIAPARLVQADAAAVVPGVVGTIEIDASATSALGVAGTSELSCVDVASGAVGIFSFHYVAKASGGTCSCLVALTGAPTIVA